MHQHKNNNSVQYNNAIISNKIISRNYEPPKLPDVVIPLSTMAMEEKAVNAAEMAQHDKAVHHLVLLQLLTRKLFLYSCLVPLTKRNGCNPKPKVQ